MADSNTGLYFVLFLMFVIMMGISVFILISANVIQLPPEVMANLEPSNTTTQNTSNATSQNTSNTTTQNTSTATSSSTQASVTKTIVSNGVETVLTKSPVPVSALFESSINTLDAAPITDDHLRVNSLCLDNPNGTPVSKDQVGLTECKDHQAQRWTYNSDTKFLSNTVIPDIKDPKPKTQCLGVVGSPTGLTSGLNVGIFTCPTASDPKFEWAMTKNSQFVLDTTNTSPDKALCLSNDGSGKTVLKPCSNIDSQVFNVVRSYHPAEENAINGYPLKLHAFINGAGSPSGRESFCLDNTDAQTSNMHTIGVSNCHDHFAQAWEWDRFNKQLRNRQTNFCMQVDKDPSGTGDNFVYLGNCSNNSRYQKWRFDEQAKQIYLEAFLDESDASKKWCLDIDYGSASKLSPGMKLKLKPCDKTNKTFSQQWTPTEFVITAEGALRQRYGL